MIRLIARLRRHGGWPIALIVVFLMGGGSTAVAAKLITGKNVKDSSLTGKDVKDRSLTGGDVKDGSIKASDISGSSADTGIVGPQGPAGSKGDKGDDGANAFGRLDYNVSREFDNPDGELNEGSVACDGDMKAVGGGAYGDAEAPGQSVNSSAPSSEDGSAAAPNRWQVWMNNQSGDDQAAFRVYVICAPAGSVTIAPRVPGTDR